MDDGAVGRKEISPSLLAHSLFTMAANVPTPPTPESLSAEQQVPAASAMPPFSHLKLPSDDIEQLDERLIVEGIVHVVFSFCISCVYLCVIDSIVLLEFCSLL